VAVFSDHISNRFVPLLCLAPITAVGYAILLAPMSAGVHYFACFLVATGVYVCAGINFSWLASNSAPDGKRAASVGIQQTIAQIAGVVSGQIYVSTAAPKYTLGHAYSMGCICVAWIGWWVFNGIMKHREKQKEEMRQTGAELTRPWDDRAPDFKYVF
jgi:hypothetical protein